MTATYQAFKLALIEGKISTLESPPVWVHLAGDSYVFDKWHTYDEIRSHILETQLIDPAIKAAQLQQVPQQGHTCIFTTRGELMICAYFFMQDAVKGQVYFDWEQLNLKEL